MTSKFFKIRERTHQWQELAKVERKLTTHYSKSVVVTILGHETQGLVVKVKVVRSPIQHLRERLPSSLGKSADNEIKRKLDNLTDPTLLDRMLAGEPGAK